MKILEVMTSQIESVQANQPVQEAAVLMKAQNVGAIPVFDGNRIAGIITDRDIVIRVIASAFNPYHISVGEIMSKDVQFCYEDENIEEAAKIMENYKIRRLLVRNKKEDLVGIVSLGDFAVHISKNLSGDIIHYISEPNRPHRQAG